MKQERVAELHHALQEADLDESFRSHGNHADTETASTATGSDLGPTLLVQVEFEGSPVNALLDTGSPVSIVSLQFLLQALAR